MRDTQPVYLTEFDVKKIIADQKKRDEQKDKSAGKEKEVTTEISTTTEVDVSGERTLQAKKPALANFHQEHIFQNQHFHQPKILFTCTLKKNMFTKRKVPLEGYQTNTFSRRIEKMRQDLMTLVTMISAIRGRTPFQLTLRGMI